MPVRETIIIKPLQPLQLNLGELWHHRDLVYIFVWRDLKVKYKQTILGLVWVVFQPLFSMIIFTLFFGRLANIPSGALPYPLFVLCGLVFWNFFSSSLSQASNSLIENSNLLNKIYFPRLILPLSAIITNIFDFFINLLLLIILLLYYRSTPSPLILLGLPVLSAIIFLTVCGLGLFMSALNVKYRDIRYLLPFFIQAFLFLTPVIYPLSSLRPTNQLIMALNPLAGIIDITRTLISGNPVTDWTIILISGFSSVLIFILGLIYFRTTEKHLADII